MLELYELDDITRSFMVVEFDAEQLHPSVPPYRPKLLSAVGLDAFMPTIRWALRSGDDERLFSELRRPALWQATQLQVRDGRPHEAPIDPDDAARRVALAEFDTWYVRGLARRMLDDGVELCEVYRAASTCERPEECRGFDGVSVPVQRVYDGHRARYHPVENPAAFSIPVGSDCRHCIRRTH